MGKSLHQNHVKPRACAEEVVLYAPHVPVIYPILLFCMKTASLHHRHTISFPSQNVRTEVVSAGKNFTRLSLNKPSN